MSIKRNSIRSTIVATFVVVAMAVGVTSSAPAEAKVTAMRAELACRSGQVLIYPPAGGRTRTNSARTRLETLSELFWYDGSARTWKPVRNSSGNAWHTGWWAYSVTDAYGQPRPPVAYASSAWARNVSNGASVVFLPVNVASGYSYAVRTWIHDFRDNSNAFVWAVLNVDNSTSNNSGDSCRA